MVHLNKGGEVRGFCLQWTKSIKMSVLFSFPYISGGISSNSYHVFCEGGESSKL